LKTLKIAFAGAHGVGKTTLCDAVKKEIDELNLYRVVTCTIPTIARACPFVINGCGTQTSINAQNWIVMKRILTEMELLNPKFSPFKENIVLLSSRSVCDDLAYLLARYPRDESVKLESEIVNYWIKTYDFIFYIFPEFPLEDDGVRDIDPIFQKQIDEIIVEQLAIRKIPKVPLHGDISERTKTVMKLIEPALRKLEKERIDEKEKTIGTLASMKVDKVGEEFNFVSGEVPFLAAAGGG
jgi:hypothetical protein